MRFLNIDNIKYPKGLFKESIYEDVETFEIVACLFEVCNLKCEFCFERKPDRSKIDNKAIETSIPDKILEQFAKEYSLYSNIRNINLVLMGGEILADFIPDETFESYKVFVQKMTDGIHRFDESIKINVILATNGVFNNTDRVTKILTELNATIAFSYDPAGRFGNKTEEDIMVDNFHRYDEMNRVSCISITLTKQCIEAFLSGNSRIEEMKHVAIDANYYVANPGYEKFIPSALELSNFLIWLVENNIDNCNKTFGIKQTLQNKKAPLNCTCKSSIQYSNGECTKDCVKRFSSLPLNRFYGKYTDEITEENCKDVQANIGMEKFNCSLCEYHTICQKYCWASMIFNDNTLDFCPLKRTYKYFESKNNEH